MKTHFQQYLQLDINRTIVLKSEIICFIEGSVITLRPNFSVTAHKSPITGLAFNPAGDKLASCSRSASICIWSVSHVDFACAELLTIPVGHSDWINDLQWSDTAEYVVTAGNDCLLKVWNARTGKECSVMSGHEASVSSTAFRSGCVASTCLDGSVKVSRLLKHIGSLITDISLNSY